MPFLTVQFKQLRWDLNEQQLSNRTTKGLRTRAAVQELRAMLELRWHDPDGEEFNPMRTCSGTKSASA